MERCVKIIGMICLLVPVSGQLTGSGALCCQQTWGDNTAVKLTFFIDESKFPSQCTSTNGKPFFERSTDGSSNKQINCTVSDIRAAGACSGSFAPGSLGCGCTAKEGGYYVMEYNFIAHPDYNGWWSASILCLDSSPDQVLSFAKSDCDNKQTQTADPDQLGVIVDKLNLNYDLLQQLLAKFGDVKPIVTIDLSFVVIIVVGGGGTGAYAVYVWFYKGKQSKTDEKKKGNPGDSRNRHPKQNQTSPGQTD